MKVRKPRQSRKPKQSRKPSKPKQSKTYGDAKPKTLQASKAPTVKARRKLLDQRFEGMLSK